MEIAGAVILVELSFGLLPCEFAMITAKYGRKIARAKKIHIKIPLVKTPATMQTIRTLMAMVYLRILILRGVQRALGFEHAEQGFGAGAVAALGDIESQPGLGEFLILPLALTVYPADRVERLFHIGKAGTLPAHTWTKSSGPKARVQPPAVRG